MRVVLLGPPGAGKGTQAARLADALGLPRVSSGDLFRDHQSRDTPLGRLARSYMERGALVPDDVTIEMVMDWVDAPGRGDQFLLDGFPRTVDQAGALERALESKGGLDRVVYMNVKKGELIARLGGRLVCRSCQATYHVRQSPPRKPGTCDRCGGELYQRDDDSPEAVNKRIEVYMQQTEPLVAWYRERSILTEIDGQGSIEEVGRRLLHALG